MTGEDAERTLRGTVGGENVAATFSQELPEPGVGKAPAKKRSGEETFGRLMLAIAAIILAARLAGASLRRVGQPQVMGEVLAGILLGPTLLGAIAPEVKDYLFPADIVPLLSGAAQIGLAFYLFLVGMELDPRILRERVGQALFISNTSVAFPLALGFLAALVVYPLLAPDVDYLPFALFMGVAMSITAFPVLARILIERRMLEAARRCTGHGRSGHRRRHRLGAARACDRCRRHRVRLPRVRRHRARDRFHGRNVHRRPPAAEARLDRL